MSVSFPGMGTSTDPHKPTTPTSAPPGTHDAAAEADLARRIFQAEARAVAGLADRLGPAFHRAVDLIVACQRAGGTVLVTGLGKSGLIGQKIAATLTSLGVTSHFVHPTEAAHGDLGAFRKADLCIALSYSGETDELIALATVLRQDALPVIAITRASDTTLAREAVVALALGDVETEADLSPAPTVSTTATLALGDALALCAAARLRFSTDDFARRHPGGSLGVQYRPIVEALRFRVGENLVPIPEGTSVARAIEMAEVPGRRPGALLIVGPDGTLRGIFTDGDLRRLVRKGAAELSGPIDRFMTRNPASLTTADRLRDAVRLVREKRCDEIPIVDELRRPVGLLDVQDLIALRLVKD